MAVTYQLFERGQAAELAAFLVGEAWPFHAGDPPDVESVRRQVADGYYDGAGTQNYWITDRGRRVGLMRLEDLSDDTPMFDLRIRAADRGRGYGRAAVAWLTDHLFTTLPDIRRIEAVTRDDNQAMRAVLVHCGYAKEAHYRNAWPDPAGTIHDAVGVTTTPTIRAKPKTVPTAKKRMLGSVIREPRRKPKDARQAERVLGRPPRTASPVRAGRSRVPSDRATSR